MCKLPKSFNGQRYRCGIYCAFEDRLLMHLCCKQKSQIHRGNNFTFSDSLPTVKSNTVFGEITLMALEKCSPEIEGKFGLPLFRPGVMSNGNNTPCLNQKRSKALSINIMKKILWKMKLLHIISEMRKITLQIRLFMILCFTRCYGKPYL